MATFPFGDFAPDLPAYAHDGLVECRNALPGTKSYRPVKQFVALPSSTLPARPLGAASFKDLDGRTHVLAGTAGSLFAYIGGAWTALATGYLAVPDYGWVFEQFGNNVIATNNVDPMQRIDLSRIGAPGAVTLLSPDAPRARLLCVVREFVVAGAVDNDVLQFRWCGQNDITKWISGVAQSGAGYLSRGGAITGMVGGEYGLILQEGAISLIDYSGGNTIFTRSEISTEIGCVASRSVSKIGNKVFFWSQYGPAMMDGIAQPVLIGDERVSRTLYAGSDRQYYRRMSAAVDPVNRVVVWTVPDRDVPTLAYVYHWPLGRWSTLDLNATALAGGYTRDLGIDDLAVLYPNIDNVPESLDSSRWLGGAPALYTFDAQYRLGTMTGPTAAARFVMGDRDVARGMVARVSTARPLVDTSAGLTLTMRGRNRNGDAYASRAYTDVRNNGRMPVRETWRLHAPALDIAAGSTWTHAQGIEFDALADGVR